MSRFFPFAPAAPPAQGDTHTWWHTLTHSHTCHTITTADTPSLCQCTDNVRGRRNIPLSIHHLLLDIDPTLLCPPSDRSTSILLDIWINRNQSLVSQTATDTFFLAMHHRAVTPPTTASGVHGWVRDCALESGGWDHITCSSNWSVLQGCLTPVKVIIPEGSILSPSDGAAVIGGNVLTSQRIVDVVFRAFNTCAASLVCAPSLLSHHHYCHTITTVTPSLLSHHHYCHTITTITITTITPS